MKRKAPIKLISVIVVGYMIFALSWWAILLQRKTLQIHDLQTSILNQEEAAFSVQQINDKYNAQKKMIWGEGSVFGIALILGIWLINRSFREELKIKTRQNNFLMSITHELRSPITANKLIMETLQKRELDQATIQKLSQSGIVEMNRLESNIEKILFTTKLDSQYTLHYESFRLFDIIRSITNEFGVAYPNHNIDYTGVKHDATADRESLYIVLKNIIENSLKYSAPHSSVIVRTQQTLKNTLVMIEDTGIGIPSKEHENVFKKFYRVGSETTRKSKGTGLGLYLSKQLIEAHNGHIRIEAKDPQGTIITLTLPNKRI